MRAAYQRPESASHLPDAANIETTLHYRHFDSRETADRDADWLHHVERAKDWDGRLADRVMIVGELGASKTILSRLISPYGLWARERLAVVGWRDVYDARVMCQMVCCTRHPFF
jgi:hypothetical protein